MLVTCGTLWSGDIEKDDRHENGTSKASKTRTVTGIASWAPTILVTVHTLERPGLGVEGPYFVGEGPRDRDQI